MAGPGSLHPDPSPSRGFRFGISGLIRVSGLGFITGLSQANLERCLRVDGGGGLLRGLCELYPGWGKLALVVSSGEMCS